MTLVDFVNKAYLLKGYNCEVAEVGVKPANEIQTQHSATRNTQHTRPPSRRLALAGRS